MSTHDELTPRTGEHVDIISMDVDRFKDVNDTHGHAAVDLLLQTLAARLPDAARYKAKAAGGDRVVRSRLLGDPA